VRLGKPKALFRNWLPKSKALGAKMGFAPKDKTSILDSRPKFETIANLLE